MQLAKPVGAQAAARKYDLITALGAFALAQGKPQQKLVLRLITLLTARYNWVRDELTVGQREIASLWACDERTVKREMAKLRDLGWLVVRRQGARGRVTEYRLDIARMLDGTRDHWQAVGPDFAQRLSGEGDQTAVVPFPTRPVPAPEGDTLWARAGAVLLRDDATIWGAWLAALREERCADGCLTLRAPNRFHAHYVQTHLLERVALVCRGFDAGVAQVRILA
jgi:hypothetical protein